LIARKPFTCPGGSNLGRLVVGLGEMKLSNDRADELVTHSLGSCLGVGIHDPLANVGGLLHIMLPSARLSPERAETNPQMFADTGLPRLFRAAYDLGATKRRLRVVLVGGAKIIKAKGQYKIGKQNYLAVRRLLWRNNVFVSAEEVGGTASRTMKLSMDRGEVTVRINSKFIKRL
jgi:chemotaxis protein CheD